MTKARDTLIALFMLCIIGALLPLLLNGCDSSQSARKEKKKPNHLVEIAVAEQREVSISRVRTGSLRAHREVKIYSQTDGRIKSLPFYESDPVRKGEIVARLDDRLLTAQLKRAQATLRQARQDVERLTELRQNNLVADDALTRAQTALEVAQADESLLKTQLEYTIIRAPISGVVSERLTEPGNIAERHAHLLTLSDPASLLTEVTVSELLLPSISVGDNVTVSIDALGRAQYQGRIVRIHPNLDPVTRRAPVEIELQPVPPGARPGQLCRVEMNTRAASRLLIPFAALRKDVESEYVYRVGADYQARKVKVRSGVRINEFIEILEGLQATDRVVSKGFLDLEDGKKVKIVAPENSARITQSSMEDLNSTNATKVKGTDLTDKGSNEESDDVADVPKSNNNPTPRPLNPKRAGSQ